MPADLPPVPEGPIITSVYGPESLEDGPEVEGKPAPAVDD